MDIRLIAGIVCIAVIHSSHADTCTYNCIWVADGTLAGSTCDMLLDPSSEVYARRRYYCSMNFATGCQTTCAIVMQETANDPTTAAPTPAPTPAPTQSSCTDALYGIQLAGGSYSCKYLYKFYPIDEIYGIYRNRKSICAQSTTDCCAACEVVARETACEDATLGVHVADGDYSCKYLTQQYPEDASIGIYNNRESICADSMTRCCASCKIVAEELACQDGVYGIKLAGGSYSCDKLLQPNPNDILGIYNNRVAVCADTMTDCCATCKVVAEETCEDEPLGVQLGGGSYPCSYLTSLHPQDAILGIYNNREAICQQSTTQCCHSCKQVAAELSPSTTLSATTEASTVTTTTGTTTTPRPVTKAPLTDTCSINCIWIADGSMGYCSWLLDPNSGVFGDRENICRQNRAPGCRKTCNTVLTDGGIIYNPGGSNSEDNVVVNAANPTTTPTATPAPVQSPVNFMNLIMQQITGIRSRQREEQLLLSKVMSNIRSHFLTLARMASRPAR